MVDSLSSRKRIKVRDPIGNHGDSLRKVIAAAVKLQVLDLSETQVLAQDVVFALTGRTHLLKQLILSKNTIECSGVRLLAKLGHILIHLDLSYNNIWEEGARHLGIMIKESKVIKSIDIRGNNIRNKGAEYIAGALIQNRSIHKLLVADNFIFDSGAILLMDSLKTHPTMNFLDISENKTGLQAKHALVNALDWFVGEIILDAQEFRNEISEDDIETLTVNDLILESKRKKVLIRSLKDAENCLNDANTTASKEQGFRTKDKVEMSVFLNAEKVEEFQRRLQILKEDNNNIETRIQVAEKELSAHDFQKQEILEKLRLLYETRGTQEKTLAGILETIEHLESCKSLHLARFADLQYHISVSAIELSELKGKLGRLSARHEQSYESCDVSRKKTNALNIEIENILGNINSAFEAKEEAQINLGFFQAEEAKLLERIAAVNSERERNRSMQNMLDEQLTENKSRLESVDEDLEATKSEVKSQATRNQELEIELLNLANSTQVIEAFQSRIASLTKERDELKQEVKNLTAVSFDSSIVKDIVFHPTNETTETKLQVEIDNEEEEMILELNDENDENEASAQPVTGPSRSHLMRRTSLRADKIELTLPKFRLFMPQGKTIAKSKAVLIADEKQDDFVDLHETPNDRNLNDDISTIENVDTLSVSASELKISPEANGQIVLESSELMVIEEIASEVLEGSDDSFENIVVASLEGIKLPEESIVVSGIAHTQPSIVPVLPPKPPVSSSKPLEKPTSFEDLQLSDVSKDEVIQASSKVSPSMEAKLQESPSIKPKGSQPPLKKLVIVPKKSDERKDPKPTVNPKTHHQSKDPIAEVSQVTAITKTPKEMKPEILPVTAVSPVSTVSTIQNSQMKTTLCSGAMFSRRSTISWTHPVFVWFSDDLSKLCWTKGSMKSVKFSCVPTFTISEIQLPVNEKSFASKWSKIRGMLKSNNEAKRVIRVVNQDRRDSFELLCVTEIAVSIWGMALQWVLKADNRKPAIEKEHRIKTHHLDLGPALKPSNLPDDLNEETILKIHNRVVHFVGLAYEEENVTYRNIREQVTNEMKMEFSHAIWKEWFRKEIDKALENLSDEESLSEVSEEEETSKSLFESKYLSASEESKVTGSDTSSNHSEQTKDTDTSSNQSEQTKDTDSDCRALASQTDDSVDEEESREDEGSGEESVDEGSIEESGTEANASYKINMEESEVDESEDEESEDEESENEESGVETEAETNNISNEEDMEIEDL